MKTSFKSAKSMIEYFKQLEICQKGTSCWVQVILRHTDFLYHWLSDSCNKIANSQFWVNDKKSEIGLIKIYH